MRFRWHLSWEDQNIRRTIDVGGPNTLRGLSEARPDSPGGVPTMSSWVLSHSSFSNSNYHRFLRSSPVRSPNPDDHDRPTIQGHLMAQYLMNLLSQHDVSQGFLGGNLENGRMGDYVFNQEGIIIISGNNSSAWLNYHVSVGSSNYSDNGTFQCTSTSPSNIIIEKLPREVLMEGCKQLVPLRHLMSIQLCHSEDARTRLCCL